MTLHPLHPAALPLPPRLAPLPLARQLAAAWWWMLKVHVAERHGLPREAAGEPPFRRR